VRSLASVRLFACAGARFLNTNFRNALGTFHSVR
jgi:hypothetical protein